MLVNKLLVRRVLGIYDYPLILFYFYSPSPDFLFCLVRQNVNLLHAHWDDELLVAIDVVVHLVRVPDKKLRGSAVQEYQGISGDAFNLDPSPRAGDRLSCRFQRHSKFVVLSCQNVDFVRLRLVAIVIHSDFVFAGRQLKGAASVAGGFVVYPNVGFFRSHFDAQPACIWRGFIF